MNDLLQSTNPIGNFKVPIIENVNEIEDLPRDTFKDTQETAISNRMDSRNNTIKEAQKSKDKLKSPLNSPTSHYTIKDKSDLFNKLNIQSYFKQKEQLDKQDGYNYKDFT